MKFKASLSTDSKKSKTVSFQEVIEAVNSGNLNESNDVVTVKGVDLKWSSLEETSEKAKPADTKK